MLMLLAQEASKANPIITFLPLILIGGVFYFLLIRPQQRRAKAQQALVRSAEVGDEIVTTGGIFGTIVDVDEDDDTLTVEIAPGTTIRMVRGGIGRRVTEDDDVEYEDDDEDSDDGYEDDDDDAGDGDADQQGPIQPQ